MKVTQRYPNCIWCGGNIPIKGKSRYQNTMYCSRWCRNFKPAWNGKKANGESVRE